jgi:hypothetical protein
MQGVMMANRKLAPHATAPIREDPGEFITRQAETTLLGEKGSEMPRAVHAGASKGLHFGYGASFGALYGLLSPRHRQVVIAGSLLGLATWAAGYLGWLPATGLMPAVTKQRPEQVAGPILTHLLFGIATAAGFERVTRSKK